MVGADIKGLRFRVGIRERVGLALSLVLVLLIACSVISQVGFRVAETTFADLHNSSEQTRSVRDLAAGIEVLRRKVIEFGGSIGRGHAQSSAELFEKYMNFVFIQLSAVEAFNVARSAASVKELQGILDLYKKDIVHLVQLRSDISYFRDGDASKKMSESEGFLADALDNALFNRNEVAAKLLSEAVLNAARFKTFGRAFIIEGRKTDLDAAKLNASHLLSMKDGIIGALQKEEESENVVRVFSNLDEFTTRFNSISSSVTAYHHYVDTVLPSYTDRFDSVLSAVVAGYAAEAAERRDDASGQLRRISLINQAAVAAGVLLGGVMAFLIGRSVAIPITNMADAMARLAGGVVEIKIPGEGRSDEIGKMAEALGMFRTGLLRKEALEKEAADTQDAERARYQSRDIMVQRFDREVSAHLNELVDAVRHVQSSSEELATIATETEKQSSSVANATAHAVESTSEVATAAEQLRITISDTGQQAANGASLSREMVHAVDDADRTIGELVSSIREIDEVVELIHRITGQTNLLALNATIEAARAGEAGRGFAVVAQEVKQLAGQAEEATLAITRNIQGIQVIAVRATESLAAVHHKINMIDEVIAAVALAAAEQAKTTQSIAGNARLVADRNGEIGESIVDVFSATQKTGVHAGELLVLSSGLTKQMQDLHVEVSRFLSNINAA